MYKAGKLPSASSNSNVGFGATFRVLGSRDYAGILGSGMATLNLQSLGLGSLHGVAAHKKLLCGFCGVIALRQVSVGLGKCYIAANFNYIGSVD